MHNPKLYMIVLGGHPVGRNIEQHDVVFAVGESIDDTFPVILRHWDVPELHLDSYMVVDQIDGFDVKIAEGKMADPSPEKLFFINLGGYRIDDMEEYHKKLLIRATSIDEAKKIAKQDSFFAEGLQELNARGHVDDKVGVFGFDVDDVMIVNESIEPKYSILLTENREASFTNNTKTIGYRVLRPSFAKS